MDQHKGLLEAALDAVNAVESRSSGEDIPVRSGVRKVNEIQLDPERIAELSWIPMCDEVGGSDVDIEFSAEEIEDFMDDDGLGDDTGEDGIVPVQCTVRPAVDRPSCGDFAIMKKNLEEARANLLRVTHERDALAEENRKLMSVQRQLNDRLERLSTDFDNYRRRVIRDQELVKNQAEERTASGMLPVMDNLERAIVHSGQSRDFDRLFQGVEMTGRMFLAALAKLGCVPFDSVGEDFDPVFHDVLQRVVGNDIPNNTIVQEHLKGYVMHERVLRPALVVVAQTERDDPPEGADNV